MTPFSETLFVVWKENFVPSVVLLLHVISVLMTPFKWNLLLRVLFVYADRHLEQQWFFCDANTFHEQECIPVGCVPSAHWPYLVVSAVWHACHAHPLPCTPPATHAHPTMHAPSPCMSPTTHARWHADPNAMQTPPASTPHLPRMPPPWTEWQTPVKILPCRNFVAGGNKIKTLRRKGAIIRGAIGVDLCSSPQSADHLLIKLFWQKYPVKLWWRLLRWQLPKW